VSHGKDVNVYRSRVVRCQRLMSEREINALFLAPGPNMYYLSGFLEEPSERLLSLIIPQSGDPLFIVPELYDTHTIRECREGMTEHQVAAKLVNELRELGADSVGFDPVVGSGSNAALPHYRSGDRKLQRGDLVVLDYGCLYRGYNSDITRTIAVGSCDDERKKAYSLVRSAQEKAYQAALGGVEAQSVDRVARDIIENAGYGQFFVHRTGHGIGLEIHEEPYIVAGNSLKLAEGMTFSIEPGIYLPGQYGVRVEDVVVMEAQRARRLNKCDRELRIL